jgi:ABC-type cobalt transport system substrate-binding protein
MMPWECACGITNSSNSADCAGCGWTLYQAVRYKRGEIGTPDKAELNALALKTFEMEMSFFRRGAFISLIVGIILFGLMFFLKIETGGVLFSLIIVMIFLCIVACIVFVYGITYADKQYNYITDNKEEQDESVEPNVKPITAIKIEPTSGLNIKRRLLGFLFGASIPIYFGFDSLIGDVIIKNYIGNWKDRLYLSIIFGLVGFFLGDKYYDNIINFWRRIKKAQ